MIKWNDILVIKPENNRLCVVADHSENISLGRRVNNKWCELSLAFEWVRWWCYCEELPGTTRMKIRLTHSADYVGLSLVKFPVEVEAKGTDNSGIFYVAPTELEKLPGFYFADSDNDVGSDYAFFRHEIEIVK